MATCDRLLGDLDKGHEQLNAGTVLVVDEAGMVGRKLGRLLQHAQQTRAKVVLVGDDRQLAAIDAGGGFRALRLRLGASELTENRRQHQARRHISRYLDLPSYINNWRRLGFTDDDFVGQGSDRLVDALVAWGDAETVGKCVKEHLDAGADHVYIQGFDVEPHSLPLSQWRTLATAML